MCVYACVYCMGWWVLLWCHSQDRMETQSQRQETGRATRNETEQPSVPQSFAVWSAEHPPTHPHKHTHKPYTHTHTHTVHNPPAHLADGNCAFASITLQHVLNLQNRSLHRALLWTWASLRIHEWKKEWMDKFDNVKSMCMFCLDDKNFWQSNTKVKHLLCWGITAIFICTKKGLPGDGSRMQLCITSLLWKGLKPPMVQRK